MRNRILKSCVHGQKKVSDCRECKALYGNRRRGHTAKYLWEAAKARAVKKGVPFTIEVSDVVIPATCPVLGIPLDGRNRDYRPCIDEIVQGQGYTPRNSAVVSCRANRIKSDATLLELQALALYVKIRSSEQYGKWPE